MIQYGFAITVPHERLAKDGRSLDANCQPHSRSLRPGDISTLSADTTSANMGISIYSHWNPFRRHVSDSTVEEIGQTAQPLANTKSKTWTTTVDRVPSWPEEARPLKKHTWITFLYGTGDLILLLLPLYFIRWSPSTYGMQLR